MSDHWRERTERRAGADLIDASVPSVARAADYVDGGHDNFEVDRKAARAVLAAAPIMSEFMAALRAFHHRVVRYLVTEAGVRQFLDIGAALPASGLTHEIAQSIDPACRVVYVASDPMVLAHTRALRNSAPGGTIDFLNAHLRDPDVIVAGARAMLDLRQPVAVIQLSTSMLAHIADTTVAAAAMSALVAGLPAGSYAAIYHAASDMDPQLRAATRQWNQLSSQQLILRSRDEVASLVAGLDLVPPGLVPACDWRPAPDDPSFDKVVPMYGVVGRKRQPGRGREISGDWRRNSARRTRADLIDSAVPNTARAADYLGGGRDNFEADRKAVRAMLAVAPVVSAVVPALRAYHHRVVRYLVAEAGVRQFLDIGPGPATLGRTHEQAQSMDPGCRVVYVSSDPMVLTHTRALTKSTPEGAVDYLEAHVRNPGVIMAGARQMLDFSEPLAILMMSSSSLASIADTALAAAAASALIAAVPSGSYVGLYHQANDLHPKFPAANRRWNQLSSQQVTLRSKDEVASLVAGLELVAPGLVPICDWQPAQDDPTFDEMIPVYGVLGRKP